MQHTVTMENHSRTDTSITALAPWPLKPRNQPIHELIYNPHGFAFVLARIDLPSWHLAQDQTTGPPWYANVCNPRFVVANVPLRDHHPRVVKESRIRGKSCRRVPVCTHPVLGRQAHCRPSCFRCRKKAVMQMS